MKTIFIKKIIAVLLTFSLAVSGTQISTFASVFDEPHQPHHTEITNFLPFEPPQYGGFAGIEPSSALVMALRGWAVGFVMTEIVKLIDPRTDPTPGLVTDVLNKVHEMNGNLNMVVGNTQEIINTLDSMQRQMSSIQTGINQLGNLIQRQGIDSIIRDNYMKVYDIYSAVLIYWNRYNRIVLDMKTTSNPTAPDHARWKTEIEDLMRVIGQRYLTPTAFYNDFLAIHNAIYGYSIGGVRYSLAAAQLDMARLDYPFEHQIIAQGVNTLNVSKALQAMLLTLFEEYTMYMARTNPNEAAKIMTDYNFYLEEIMNNMNTHLENTPLKGIRNQKLLDTIRNLEDIKVIFEENYIRDLLKTRITLENGKVLDTYHVTINHSMYDAMIARQAYRMGDFFTPSNVSTYIEGRHSYRSADGLWAAPFNSSDMYLLIPSGVTDPFQWLTVTGGLGNYGTVDCFALNAAAKNPGNTNRSFLHARQAPNVHDSIFTLEVTNNGITETSQYFYTRGVMNPNNAVMIPIFYEYTHGTDKIPRDGNVLRPVSVELDRFPRAILLKDGDVLDLRGIVGVIHFNPAREVIVQGNAKIISDGREINNLTINLLQNSHVILENLNIQTPAAYGGPLVARGYASQARIVGNVQLSHTDQSTSNVNEANRHVIYLLNRAGLSVFGGGTDPVLNLNGSLHTYNVSTPFEAQNLRLNFNDEHIYPITIPAASIPDYYRGFDFDTVTSSHRYARIKNCDIYVSFSAYTYVHFYAHLENCVFNHTNPNSNSAIVGYADSSTRLNTGYVARFGYKGSSEWWAGSNGWIRTGVTGVGYNGASLTAEFITATAKNVFSVSRGSVRETMFTYAYQYALSEDKLHMKMDLGDDVKIINNTMMSINRNYMQHYPTITMKKKDHTYTWYPTDEIKHNAPAPHIYAAERVPQAGVNTMPIQTAQAASLPARSSCGLFMSEDVRQRALDYIEGIGPDESVHIPVILGSGFVRGDGELLRALAQSEGELYFEVMNADGSFHTSIVFNASKINTNNIENFDLRVSMGAPAAMGHSSAGLPAHARIFRPPPIGGWIDSVDIILRNSNLIYIREGELFDVYCMFNGIPERIGTGIAADSADDLTITLNRFGDIAIVPRRVPVGPTPQPLPPTDSGYTYHHDEPVPTPVRAQLPAPTPSQLIVQPNGNVNISVQPNQANQMIREATEAKTGKVVFDLTHFEGATGVTLPAAFLRGVANANLNLEIALPGGTVTFGQAALTNIIRSAQGIGITVTVAQQTAVENNPVFELTVSDGTRNITEFSAPVEVRIGYTPHPGQNLDALVVYHVDADGGLKIMRDVFFDTAAGKMVFTTTHFSMFMIVHNLVSFYDVTEGH